LISGRRSLHAPQYESSNEDSNHDEFDDNTIGTRSKSSKPMQLKQSSGKHESFIFKDKNPLEIGRMSVIVKNDDTSKNSLVNTAANNKLPQSVYQRHSVAQDNILSPLKKQFGKLVNKKEDINLDEQT